MVDATGAPLTVRTRVSIWGAVVALATAFAFLWGAALSLAAPFLPRRLGPIIDPPVWALGAAFFGFALILFMVGVAELVRYLKPSIEVLVDDGGIVTVGLLGERRYRWRDVTSATVHDDLLIIRAKRSGGVPGPAMRIHFSRLDVEPRVLVAAIRTRRPDLLG